MLEPKVKLGTVIKATNPQRRPDLMGMQGKVVCYYYCPDHILYGIAFDNWNDGHSLKLAQPGAKPEHLASLVGHKNCWWLEEYEMVMLYEEHETMMLYDKDENQSNL